jgi:hypothetical protein
MLLRREPCDSAGYFQASCNLQNMGLCFARAAHPPSSSFYVLKLLIGLCEPPLLPALHDEFAHCFYSDDSVTNLRYCYLVA